MNVLFVYRYENIITKKKHHLVLIRGHKMVQSMRIELTSNDLRNLFANHYHEEAH